MEQRTDENRCDSGPLPLEWLFLAFLTISQVYYGYRYLFKYSDSGTSPTYSDTPWLFQVMKYVIALAVLAAMICVIAAQRGLTRRVSRDVLIFLGVLGAFVVYCLALGLTFLDSTSIADILVFRGFFFLPILALLPFHYTGPLSLRRYAAVLKFACVYHLLYTLIQLLAYFAIGRLPALGYAQSLVRFGGGWDDPNGFAGFLALPILLVVSDAFFKPIKRAALLAVLTCLLALTVSASGFIGVLCAIAVYSALRWRIRLMIGMALSAVVVLAQPQVQSILAFLYDQKRQSIVHHLRTLSVSDFVSGANALEILFGQHGIAASNEAFYVDLAENYGAMGLAGFLVILALTLVNGVTKARHYAQRQDYRSAEILRVLVAFIAGESLASIGIAMYLVFPVNLCLWTAILVIWVMKAEHSSTSPRAVSQVLPPYMTLWVARSGAGDQR